MGGYFRTSGGLLARLSTCPIATGFLFSRRRHDDVVIPAQAGIQYQVSNSLIHQFTNHQLNLPTRKGFLFLFSPRTCAMGCEFQESFLLPPRPLAPTVVVFSPVLWAGVQTQGMLCPSLNLLDTHFRSIRNIPQPRQVSFNPPDDIYRRCRPDFIAARCRCTPTRFTHSYLLFKSTPKLIRQNYNLHLADKQGPKEAVPTVFFLPITAPKTNIA